MTMLLAGCGQEALPETGTPAIPDVGNETTSPGELPGIAYVKVPESASVEIHEVATRGLTKADTKLTRALTDATSLPDVKPITYSPTMGMMSRAEEEYPFNDENLPAQWHYHNTGATPNSVAGADINLFDAWKYTTGDPDYHKCFMFNPNDFTAKSLKDFFASEYGVEFGNDNRIKHIGSEGKTFFGLNDVITWYMRF